MPVALVPCLLALMVWSVCGSVEGCGSCEAGDEVVRLRCELNKVTSLLHRTIFFSEEQLASIQGELGQYITAALQARREEVGGAGAPVGKAARNDDERWRVPQGDGKAPRGAAVSMALSPSRPSLGSPPPDPRPHGGLSGVDGAARPWEGWARGVGWPGSGLGPDPAALGGWSGRDAEGQTRSHRQPAETASQPAAASLAAAFYPADGARPACEDSPAGWVDKHGHGCAEYAALQWCAGDGGPGPGWPASRGSLADQASGGHTAATACCVCRPRARDTAGRGCDHYAQNPLQCGCCDDEHFIALVACADVCSLGNHTARRPRSLQTQRPLSAFIAAIPSTARGIALPGYGLAGTLPAELGRFVDLRLLDLRGNQLMGTLPRELGTLTQLQALLLEGNALTGTIPGELGNLTELQVLHLDGNNLTGTLPRELSGLTHLLDVNVSVNQIDGTVPSELGNLRNLRSLSFWGNKLTGTLPKELSTLTELQTLAASYNRFTGTLPRGLGNLSKLQRLYVNNNLLTGTLPIELGGLTSVQLLILADNELTGTLPEVLGTMTELQALDASGNHFMGTLPNEVGNLAKLYLLNVSKNQLTGTLPSELGKLVSLQVLNVVENHFTGTLPSELGKLTSLQVLAVATNQLTGTLPSELGNLTSLQVLSVATNQFMGTLPKELGNLATLQTMLAFSNRLTGTLPSELGNLKALRAFDVAANALTGTLPHELGSLTMLQRLSLGSNSFTGILPRELWKLTSLQVLLVFGNLLTGTLPSELGNMTSLRTFDASSNQIFGTLPNEIAKMTALQVFAITNNQFSGTLPNEFGEMTALQVFSITDNQFSGTLPSELGNMTALQTLSVQGNRFVGTLPDELCKLGQLQVLAVSRNQLTGTLPSEIGKLTQLLHLHIETNQLTGTLPTALGGLTQLEEFAAFQNQFSGTLPSELGNMTGLLRLSVYSNKLAGTLPGDLGRLTNLQSLDTSDNLLSGTLPKELGKLTKLLDLRLDGNAFTGAVPKELGLLRHTTGLYLQNNNFTELPGELGQMEALVNLNVQGNPFLHGAFPDTSGCRYLTAISASNCSFVTAGAVGPLVTILSFARNKFASLPEAWVELPSVTQLDLSDNRLATWAPFGVLPLGTFAPDGSREKCGIKALWRRLDWPAMEQVKLSGNPLGQSITVRDFLWSLGYLPRLFELEAARCGLRGGVPYEGDFFAMDMVDTGDRACTQVPVERIGFQDLLRLDLSGNSISSVLAPPPARLIEASLHSNALDGVSLNPGWFSVFGTLEVWDNPLLRAAVAPPKVCRSQGEDELAADVYGWGGSLNAFECTVLCPGTRSHYKHDTWLNVSRLCRCKAGMQGSGMNCTGCPRDTFSDMDPADPDGMVRMCHQCPLHSMTDVENATSIDQCQCPVGWYMGKAPEVDDNTTNGTDDGASKLAAGKACVRCPQAQFMTTKRGATSADQCLCNPAYGGLRGLLGRCGCDDGMYMDHIAMQCKSCDHAAEECTWGADVQLSLEPPVIKASYWAAPPGDVQEGELSNFSGNEIWRCVSKETCPGGGACADGREGRACSLCSEGMFGGPDGDCTPCPRSPQETRKFLLLALLVGPLATMGAHFLVQGADEGMGQLFQKLGALRTSVKQLLKYVQLLGVLSVFSVNWPPLARQFFADITRITVAMPQIAGPACLTGKQTVAVEMGFRWLLPVAGLASTCLTGLLLLPLRWCCRGRSWHARTNMGVWDVVRICLWGLVLFYSTLLQFGTQILTCMASPNGKYTVQTFPHLVCGRSREWERLAAVSVCFLVVFVLAVFAGVYGAWRRTTHALIQSDLKSKGWWGFLFDDFRRGSVHWVMLIMLRDVVLVVIATAGAGDGPGQLVATAGVSIVYSYVVLRDQPFVEPSNSLLEAWTSMSLAALSIFSAGMGFQSTAGVEDVAELFSDGASDALYESRAQAMLVVQWCTLLGPICILTFQCVTMFARVRRRVPAILRPMEEEEVQGWNREFLASLGLQGDTALRGVIEGLDYVESAQFRQLMGSTAATIGIAKTTAGLLQGAGRRRMSHIAKADQSFVPLARRILARLSVRRTRDRPSSVGQRAHDGQISVDHCEDSWRIDEDTTVAFTRPSAASEVICDGLERTVV